MSRSGRVDVAVRLARSGGADPGVVGVVDVWFPEGELPDDQLGRNFLFCWGGVFFLDKISILHELTGEEEEEEGKKKRQGTFDHFKLTWAFSQTLL